MSDETLKELLQSAREPQPGDRCACIWPSDELRNISADGRELAAHAIHAFRKALSKGEAIVSVSEKMRKAGAEVLWSLADTEGDGPAFERVSESIYLAMQQVDDERNRLLAVVHAAKGLSRGTDWNNGTHAKLHGYRQKLLDALAALTADDGQGVAALRNKP